MFSPDVISAVSNVPRPEPANLFTDALFLLWLRGDYSRNDRFGLSPARDTPSVKICGRNLGNEMMFRTGVLVAEAVAWPPTKILSRLTGWNCPGE